MNSESRRGWIYYKIVEQIQSLWSYAHQDVAARLNSSCEISREELGRQLNWIKDFQGNMIQRMQNLANAVATRLIQNEQRNQTQEGIMDGLYIELQNSTVTIDKNSQGIQ